MDTDALGVFVVIALAATAVNSFLIVRLSKIIQTAPGLRDLAFAPPTGSAAPAFRATKLSNGLPVTEKDLIGAPSVLIFLSARCPTCNSKIPEIAEIIPATKRHGIKVFVVGMENKGDVLDFVGPPLLNDTLIMKRRWRKRLNPSESSPFYIFLNEAGIVEAAEHLGDENWRIFCNDMRAPAAA